MGSTEPPQRKGHLPMYNSNKVLELQQKCDNLENMGVFRWPEDVGVKVECLKPSFLIRSLEVVLGFLLLSPILGSTANHSSH